VGLANKFIEDLKSSQALKASLLVKQIQKNPKTDEEGIQRIQQMD
jgi:hypothetical protein